MVRTWMMVGLGAVSVLLAVLAACREPSSDDAPIEVLVKLEWGSVTSGAVAWSGTLALSEAELLESVPYVFDEGDTFDATTLTFSGDTDSMLTDGLLLRLKVRSGSRLGINTAFGQASIDLKPLAVDNAKFLSLDGQRYVEVARITPEEWELAISYNTRPANRTDALPRPAYEAYLVLSRYNSSDSLDEIYQDSLTHFEDDAFYRNAETLRRAVNQQLYVTVPSVLAEGEVFDVAVAAFDVNGRLVTDFEGPILLHAEGEGDVELPDSWTFTAGSPSLRVDPEAGRAIRSGYVRITAIDESGRFASGSIPVRIEVSPQERVFWGDMHTHSNLSDGDYADVGPEDVYAYGRDIARLDFQTVSDHDYRRAIPDWKWPLHIAAAATFYEPGRFVSFLGYEWSGEDVRFSDVISHKNVYLRGDTGTIYSAFDPRYNTPEKLWAALRSDPGVGETMTIPHHTVRKVELSEEDPWYGGAGTDWRYHDEEMQPLTEVYSRWGSSEFDGSGNPRPVRNTRGSGSAQYALGLGYRLGLIASGDIHDGTPGVSGLAVRWSINAYPTGLVAALAPTLAREDVFDALYTRRCYGTSGGRRMLLDLRTSSGIRAGEIGHCLLYTSDAADE